MVGFWYNKGLFEQAGIDAPPTSWTALLDDVKKLKDAKITPIAIGGKDEWPGAFWWEYLATRLGGEAAFQKAYNRSGSFADKPFVDAGTMLKQLVDLQPFQTGFLGAAYPDQQVLMANGQAAMELMGQWAPGADRAVAKDVDAYTSSLGYFPFPVRRRWRGRRPVTCWAAPMASLSVRTPRLRPLTSCGISPIWRTSPLWPRPARLSYL